MSTTYTKSLSLDFGGILNAGQMHSEISAESGITATLKALNMTNDAVLIVFESALTSGEESILNTLISDHVIITNTPGDIFDAIVDASGNGDYLLPSTAFDAGHMNVFMRNGIYVETTDVNVPNYGKLTGESGPNTIIYFPGLGKSVKCDGSNGVQETSGTVSINNGTKIVVGSGTSFTNLSSGNYILLGTNYFKIASIELDTALTLVETYQGSSISGFVYVAQAMYSGIYMQNFVVTGSATNGVYIRACRHFVVDSVAMKSNYNNIKIAYSGDSALKHILSEACADVGVSLNNCASIALNVVDAYNNIGHGIEITGTSISINLMSCEASNNGGTGICVMGNAIAINLTDCVIKYNNGNGILITSTVRALMTDSTTVRGNTLKGMSISGSEHTVTGSVVEENSDIGIDILAFDAVISCTIVKNNTTGIKITGDNNIVTACNVTSNSLDGLLVVGNDCIMNGNIIKLNTQTGITIETGSTDTICVYNNLKNNTGASLTDNGTSSNTTGNKTS